MAKIQLWVEIFCSILNNKIWIRVTSPKRHFMRASIRHECHFFELQKSVTWPKNRHLGKKASLSLKCPKWSKKASLCQEKLKKRKLREWGICQMRIGKVTSRCTVAKWRVALENYPDNLKIRYVTQYIRYLAFLIRNFFWSKLTQRQ